MRRSVASARESLAFRHRPFDAIVLCDPEARKTRDVVKLAGDEGRRDAGNRHTQVIKTFRAVDVLCRAKSAGETDSPLRLINFLVSIENAVARVTMEAQLMCEQNMCVIHAPTSETRNFLQLSILFFYQFLGGIRTQALGILSRAILSTWPRTKIQLLVHFVVYLHQNIKIFDWDREIDG